MRAVLLALEGALAVVLLVIAGLLLQTVDRLMATDAGFRGDGVTTMLIGRVHDLGPAARERFYTEVLRRVADVPGVQLAALNDYVLLSNEDDYEGFEIEGRPRLPSGGWSREEWRRVSADYFQALEIQVVEGRGLTRFDTAHTPSVVVINEAMARKYWDGADPIGRRIRITDGAYGWSEIVGIIADVREVGLDRPAKPMMFVPYHRAPRPTMALFARVGGDPSDMVEPIRRAVWSVDPGRPVFGVRHLDRIVSESMAVRRIAERVSVFMAALAAVLTAVGIYAATSYAVSRRKRDIAIRTALGAPSRTVILLVLRQGTRPIIVGLGPGLAAGFFVARVAQSQLYEVSAFDPLTYAAVVLVVSAVALGACWLPAVRASRIDPVEALWAE